MLNGGDRIWSFLPTAFVECLLCHFFAKISPIFSCKIVSQELLFLRYCACIPLVLARENIVFPLLLIVEIVVVPVGSWFLLLALEKFTTLNRLCPCACGCADFIYLLILCWVALFDNFLLGSHKRGIIWFFCCATYCLNRYFCCVYPIKVISELRLL